MSHKLYYKLTLITLIAQIILHLLIQILSLLLMLEIGYEPLDGFNYIGLGEIIFMEDGFEIIKEGVNFIHIVTGGLLYYAKSQEALHVNLLTGDVELLIGLFTGGI